VVSALTVLEPFSGDELRQLRTVEEAGLHDMQEGGHYSSALFSFFTAVVFVLKIFESLHSLLRLL
jgi:hypothetical protein